MGKKYIIKRTGYKRMCVKCHKEFKSRYGAYLHRKSTGHPTETKKVNGFNGKNICNLMLGFSK